MQNESWDHSKSETGCPNPVQVQIETLLMHCVQYHQKGDLRAAERCCQAILQRDPNHSETHLCLGKLQVAQGKMNRAIDHYRQALVLKPNSAQAYKGLGDALLAIGHKQAAIRSYREAIRLDPNDVAALNDLGIALRADEQIDKAVSAARTSASSLTFRASNSAADRRVASSCCSRFRSVSCRCFNSDSWQAICSSLIRSCR